MTAENAEPVEISTRFRPGEWTEARLTALTASYQEKIVAMGAASEDIATSIDRGMDGSVAVSVSWDPGAQDSVPAGDAAGSPAGRDAVEGNPEIARGFGEDIPPGDITEDAKGLGAGSVPAPGPAQPIWANLWTQPGHAAPCPSR